jgi:CheY-like chemotaxis protein/P2-related tail formation protein
MDNNRIDPIGDVQRAQIEDWLRQTDKHIRGGRYLAADELLQKVFVVHPENNVARSYQDRIQFLIKQLSQRVGLESDLYEEIRKYRELLLKRKSNQINTLINSAHKLLDEGQFKKASDQANKALAIDPENIYAKGLLQRLIELQNKAGSAITDTEREFKFCSTFKEKWQTGEPSEERLQALNILQEELKISQGRRLELEREIKNDLYRGALREIWQTGGLSAFTSEIIDTLRKKFSISRIDHSFIESSLLKEFRKNKIKGNILIVGDNDDMLLEISSHLRSNFYAVISAGTLDEALASLKIVTPDIILSELSFQSGPVGFELFEFIRTRQGIKYIPFIFMTSSLDRTTRLIGKRLGVNEFIIKPTDYELLVATIDGILRYGSDQISFAKHDERFLARSFQR